MYEILKYIQNILKGLIPHFVENHPGTPLWIPMVSGIPV